MENGWLKSLLGISGDCGWMRHFWVVFPIFDEVVCENIIPFRSWTGSKSNVISPNVTFWGASACKMYTQFSAEILLLVCVFSESRLCIVESRRLRLPLLSPPAFLKREVIKSSMGATGCSSHPRFEAVYLEMNRRPFVMKGEKRTFYWRLWMQEDAL